MSELSNKIDQLESSVIDVYKKLFIEDIDSKIAELEKQSQSSDFWNDNENAKNVMQEISKLKNIVDPWNELIYSIKENKDLVALDDESIEENLKASLKLDEARFEVLKKDLRYNGEYDASDVIMSIFAGAGGTDAQDWAEMLERMYLRYCEKIGFEVSVLDRSRGDEAGLKSVTLTISGKFAYGNLKSEDGVHRLVRLSPFNSDNLRQTSFARVEILPKIDQPKDLDLDDKDLRIDYYRSGGHGGQSVNTTDSAVRITHIPTGVTVAIQNERSQMQNRELALSILKSKLVHLRKEQHVQKIADLKGPNQSAEWGNQIRSYVLHPYKQVKDLRSGFESSDPDKILDGELDQLIDSYLNANIGIKDKH